MPISNLPDVTAVILCGGLGSRLRPVVPDVPKILAPVQRRPMLAWQLDRLERAGIRDVIICQAIWWEQVKAVFGDFYGREWEEHDENRETEFYRQGLRLRYTEEPEPLGTGGALRLACPLIENETVLVLNGDTYSANDIPAILKIHHLGLTVLFQPNPAVGVGLGVGLYVVDRAVLEMLPNTLPLSWEKLILNGDLPCHMTLVKNIWPFYDMGTPEGYAAIQQVNLAD